MPFAFLKNGQLCPQIKDEYISINGTITMQTVVQNSPAVPVTAALALFKTVLKQNGFSFSHFYCKYVTVQFILLLRPFNVKCLKGQL